MLIVFHDRFPKRYRRRVERLVKEWAKVYNLTNGWECLVTTEVASDVAASVDCALESHSIQLDLFPGHLKNLAALDGDIAHELWHILYWRTMRAMQKLPERHRTAVLAAFEEDHDAATRVWLRHRPDNTAAGLK